MAACSLALVGAQAPKPDPSKFLAQPLVRDIYTADPSAHVFNGKIFIYQGKWYLFYHDAQTSGGQTHLRNIKVTELKYRADGSIVVIDAYIE